MKSLVSILVLMRLTWLVSAQAPIDSLMQLLSSNKEDTNYVLTSIEVSKYWLRAGNPSQAIKYNDEAKRVSEKIKFQGGMARSYQMGGNIRYANKEFQEAITLYKLSLSLSEELNDKNLIAISHFSLGNVYNAQQKHTDALQEFTTAISILKSTNYLPLYLNCHRNIGNIHLATGNYTEAKKYHLLVLDIGKELKDQYNIALTYKDLGIVTMYMGNYNEAIHHYNQALEIGSNLKDKTLISDSYHTIGIVNYFQGNFTEALTYYLKALAIREEIGNRSRLADSYNDIGHIYLAQRNEEEALKYYLKANAIFKETGNKQRISVSYNSLGGLYSQMGNFEESLKYHQASLDIKKEIGDKQGIIASYSNMASIYISQGRYLEAKEHLLSGLALSEEIGYQSGIASCYYNLGRISIESQAHAEAKQYLEQALSISKQIGEKDLIQFTYKHLARLDSAMGNYKQAYEHHKLYKFYSDTLRNESNNEVMAEMETQYETLKKDKEIQHLENEKKIHQLQIQVQHESLDRIKLEKDKIHAENLVNIQRVELLANEKRLQQSEIDKNHALLLAQQAETERQKELLLLANSENEVKDLKLKRQSIFKTYWIIGFILFGVISFLIYGYYLTRQKLKLQTLRNKIASDLHDDVGSTLSSISIFSQMAKHQSKDITPLLDSIGESSRQMLDAMADIVWTIKPENDQFEKIILRMRSFAYELLGAKNIEFEFTAEDDISLLKLPMEVRKNLYLIFKEATNNLVKYAEANKATFTISEEKNVLRMMIRDNGKGFDINRTTEGNGIKNMRKRAEEIGGRLFIESKPGDGTTIQLSIAV